MIHATMSIGLAFLILACLGCTAPDSPPQHVQAESPHLATLNAPVICARDSSDFDEFDAQIGAGERTAAKNTAMRLIAQGKAMELDKGTAVEVISTTAKLAMIRPVRPTESGDQYSCFTYRGAVE